MARPWPVPALLRQAYPYRELTSEQFLAVLGMLAILDKKPCPVSAVCIHDSEVYHIPAGVFEELLGRHPEFSREVFKYVGSHLRHSQVMRSLAKEPVDRRLAHILCLLGDMLGKDLRGSREDIAEMAGCTPETAIRVLVDFRKKKLIASGWKRIALVDPAGLKAFAG